MGGFGAPLIRFTVLPLMLLVKKNELPTHYLSTFSDNSMSYYSGKLVLNRSIPALL